MPEEGQVKLCQNIKYRLRNYGAATVEQLEQWLWPRDREGMPTRRSELIRALGSLLAAGQITQRPDGAYY